MMKATHPAGTILERWYPLRIMVQASFQALPGAWPRRGRQLLTMGTHARILIPMSVFDWNPEKNAFLEREREIGFEEVVFHIQNGDVLAILKHPHPERYPNQKIIVLNVEGYVYLVPYAKEQGKRFFKTIIPSRKATRKYLP